MPPLRALAIAVASAATLVAGCTDADSGAEAGPVTPCSAATARPTSAVSIASMQFVPFCVTIAPGAEITFTNLDTVDHSVTADAGQPEPFESGLLLPGQQYTHAFARPETVRVHDRLNPQVSGVVIVE